MKTLPNNSVDMTLTDIPYGEASCKTNGLTNLKSLDNLGAADRETFDEIKFCEEVYRITKNSICIFCGRKQFSTIYQFFKNKKGTVRPIVWEKTNPVPSNGKYVYLSGVEFAVWFKKAGGKSFNAYCKNTVFRYPIPSGQKRIHKTQKHWDLWKEIMLDCSNENEIIFDPCTGSGVTAWVAKENNRNLICCELDKEIFDISKAFLQSKNIIT